MNNIKAAWKGMGIRERSFTVLTAILGAMYILYAGLMAERVDMVKAKRSLLASLEMRERVLIDQSELLTRRRAELVMLEKAPLSIHGEAKTVTQWEGKENQGFTLLLQELRLSASRGNTTLAGIEVKDDGRAEGVNISKKRIDMVFRSDYSHSLRVIAGLSSLPQPVAVQSIVLQRLASSEGGKGNTALETRMGLEAYYQ